MKALKFTLVMVAVAAMFASCTKQDLNEDDVQINRNENTLFVGDGTIDAR